MLTSVGNRSCSVIDVPCVADSLAVVKNGEPDNDVYICIRILCEAMPVFIDLDPVFDAMDAVSIK